MVGYFWCVWRDCVEWGLREVGGLDRCGCFVLTVASFAVAWLPIERRASRPSSDGNPFAAEWRPHVAPDSEPLTSTFA